jgi:hypothetical protein
MAKNKLGQMVAVQAIRMLIQQINQFLKLCLISDSQAEF